MKLKPVILKMFSVIVAIILLPLSFAGATICPMGFHVGQTLEMAMNVYRGDVWTNLVSGDLMDFGNLNYDGFTGLTAENYFTVVFFPSTNGGRYQITQTAHALENSAGDTLPTGACVVTPWAVDPTNGQSFPGDHQVGAQGSFVADDKLIYKSDAAGTYNAVAATYAITSNPDNGSTARITRDQKVGEYESCILFELSLAN